MPSAVRFPKALIGDRIQWMAVLIVACFVSVLLLKSQSRASYPTYALAILMIVTFPQWRDVLQVNLMRWIIALLLWLCLSVFWSDPFEWRAAISVWTRALLVFFFVVAFAECQLRGQLQRWMGVALTVVGAGAVLAAIVNYYLTNPEDGRLNGLGQLDTHVVAALVYGVVLIFVLQTLQLAKSPPIRVATLLVAGIIIFAIAVSDSRNAWVSVTLGVGCFVLAHSVKDPKQFVVSIVSMVFLLLVVIFLLAANEAARDLVLPRGDSFRLVIWTTTIDRILEQSLLFGRGILTNDDVAAGGILFPHPHNMYIALVHQGGLVALTLYVGVITKTVVLLLSRYTLSDSKLALSVLGLALVAHLLDGHELVDKVGDTWLLVWLPIGLSVGLSWQPK